MKVMRDMWKLSTLNSASAYRAANARLAKGEEAEFALRK